MGMVVRFAALVLSLMMLLTMGLVSADAGAAGDAVAPSAIFAADTPKAASTRTAPEVVSSTTTTESTKESPWLIVPTFSSNPKLGTSLGFMAAYMHYFDEQSQVSMFGVNAQYTDGFRDSRSRRYYVNNFALTRL